jgi:hypothetical protein
MLADAPVQGDFNPFVDGREDAYMLMVPPAFTDCLWSIVYEFRADTAESESFHVFAQGVRIASTFTFDRAEASPFT